MLEEKRIRIATMNYGLWNDGITKYVEDEKVPAVLECWKQMLAHHNADVVAGQEYRPFFNRSNTMLSDQCLFSFLYPYQYSTTTGYGKNLVSKTVCTDYAVRSFSTDKTRQYTVAHTVIRGTRVCILNAHCSLETDFSIHRKAEFEELIRIASEEKHVILLGDFNAYSVSEFEIFQKAGYRIANGGEFGIFDTWTNFDKPSSWENRAIDNIIVSEDIRILNVSVDRRDLSDHSMLVADLVPE